MSVVYQREQEDQPGDFPVQYVLSVHDLGKPFIKLLSSLAHDLHVALLSDFITSPGVGDDDWKMFLPDGTFHVVELDPDAFDNDALVLQENDRVHLERNWARSAHRVAA